MMVNAIINKLLTMKILYIILMSVGIIIKVLLIY